MLDEYNLSLSQVARAFNISHETARRWALDGTLDAIQPLGEDTPYRVKDHVAYLITKGAGSTDPSYALTDAQLAQVYNAALKGNPAARIALAKMPANQQRWAKNLHEGFSDEPAIKKSKKPKKINKSLSEPGLKKAVKQFKASESVSANPADREFYGA